MGIRALRLVAGTAAVAATASRSWRRCSLIGSYRGTLYYFWQASGGTVWHRQQVSAKAGAAPLVPPSIAAQRINPVPRPTR